MYKIAEIFESINGEGRKAGQLAVFIRFSGCNLSCTYCDTKWASGENAEYTLMSAGEICERIKRSGIKNVTLTGGEPLIQPDIKTLIKKLVKDKNIYVEIETNGSVDISPFSYMKNSFRFRPRISGLTDEPNGIEFPKPSFTVDYKLPSSGMEQHMFADNFVFLNQYDTVKFVIGTKEDLLRAEQVINTYELQKKHCTVYISPIYGKIEPREIVEFMKEKKLNGVNLQLQLHKYIWNPNERGV